MAQRTNVLCIFVMIVLRVMYVGFEKMEHGLSEKFTDKTSPIKNHTDTLVDLGADSHPIHHMNAITSDVIKVLFYNNTAMP